MIATAPSTEQNQPTKHRTLKSLLRFRKPNIEQNHQTKPLNKTSKPSTKLSVVNSRAGKTQVEFDSLVSLETSLQCVENLIHILTPRLLVLGFVLSMVDLLTHGGLLNFPAMVYIWAIVQALAVDATLPNMWRLAFTRFDERRWIAGSILLVIGICLGLVVFAALAIQFLQQSENIALNQAMSKLYVSPEILTYVRSGSVVFLAAVLSVLNRTKVNSKHRAENKTVNIALADKTVNTELVSTEPERTVNTELTDEPDKTVNTEHHKAIQRTPLHVVSSVNSQSESFVTIGTSKHEQIRAILEQEPDTTVTALVKAIGVSKGYASQQKAKFLETR